MNNSIVTLVVSVLAISAVSHAVIFSDDFESGTLSQWTIDGRQAGRESTAEVVTRHGSQMAHVYQDGLTDIRVEKTFDYRNDLTLSFDMETSVYSEATDPESDWYASAGATYSFLDSDLQVLGFVRFRSRTIIAPPNPNPGPNTAIFEVEPSLQNFNFSVQDLLSLIVIEEDNIAHLKLYFGCYTSGNMYNMHAHTWVDNVVVKPKVPIGLEIVGTNETVEDSQTPYRAIAHYEDGSSGDVTALADWSVEPNDVAGVSAGLLTTERINFPTDVTITAQYGQGDNIHQAQKDVSIVAICPGGSALEFDGVDDYVDCGNNNSFDMTDEITISAWVKRSHFNTADVIAGKNNGNPVTAGYGLFSYTQGFEFNFYSEGKWRRTTPRVPATSNQWHHIAGTYDGENLHLYVDGEQKASLGYVGTMTPAVGYPLNIAYWRSSLPAHFDGLIDEVAIYDRALSVQEIQQLMHRKPDADDPSLVGYWDLDEGAGQVVYDSSAYGHHGTLGSSPDIDDSDPTWVESDAPTGICTLEGLVERNLVDVWNAKISILEQLYEVMSQEAALLEYMDEKFADRDLGDTSQGDVAKAKQKVMGAIQAEGQAGTSIDQSLDKLDDAMNTLGIGTD